jgi:hypothetical protein
MPRRDGSEGLPAPSALLQMLEVGQHLGRESGCVGHVVGLADDSFRVDEVGSPQCEIGALVVALAYHLVLCADTLVDVGQKVESERLGIGERLVVSRCVEGGAEHDEVGSRDLGGPVTQALALDRSAPGRGLRIPPEEDSVTPEVGERHGCAVLVREAEVRGFGADVEHGTSVIGIRRSPGLTTGGAHSLAAVGKVDGRKG